MNTNIIIVDDDYIDNFIANKLIHVRYPQIRTIIFENIFKALRFIKQLEIKQQRYILMLDLYVEPDWAWDFLDTFEQLPQTKQSAFDIYMMSCSCEKKSIDKAKEFKTIKAYFEKPIKDEQLSQMLA